MRSFGSDNHAGAHPDVLAAVAAANRDHALSYGDDEWTRRATELVRERFGGEAEVFFVFNGTGANVLCLSALCRPWEAVICAGSSHINTDEAAAPEIAGRVKLLPVAAVDGKLTPELCAPMIRHVGEEHHAQARVISISQTTELGTVYTADEITALADFAHAHDLLLHVDGARLFNAHQVAWPLGADAVSLGATKVGGLGAEAAVFVRGGVPHARFVRKQLAQLASKHRFLAAQFIALLEDGLADRLAAHANAMAARLADAVEGAVTVTRRPQANAVFAVLPPEVTARLQERWPFYVWDEHTGEVRWMTSWDTTPDEVDAFAAAVLEALGRVVQ